MIDENASEPNINMEESKTISDEYYCPITHEIMKDPVVASDGFTYERAAIEKWLSEKNTSPKTNEALPDKRLVPNTSFKILIRDRIQTQSLTISSESVLAISLPSSSISLMPEPLTTKPSIPIPVPAPIQHQYQQHVRQQTSVPVHIQPTAPYGDLGRLQRLEQKLQHDFDVCPNFVGINAGFERAAWYKQRAAAQQAVFDEQERRRRSHNYQFPYQPL